MPAHGWQQDSGTGATIAGGFGLILFAGCVVALVLYCMGIPLTPRSPITVVAQGTGLDRDGPFVCGVIRNDSGKPMRNIRVKVVFYDRDGVRIGDATRHPGELDPGEMGRFVAHFPAYATRFRIADIDWEFEE